MAGKPSPIDIQKALGGMDYPATKADIVKKAEGSNADKSVLDALGSLPSASTVLRRTSARKSSTKPTAIPRCG